MTTKTLELNNIERVVFWALAVGLGAAIALYLYSVLSMTVSVVARDRVLSEVRTLSATASELEQEYMNMQNSVTLAHAETLGFKEVAPKFSTGSSAPLAVLR